jgi:ribosomal protein S18 acetylase RimI-like enzyme
VGAIRAVQDRVQGTGTLWAETEGAPHAAAASSPVFRRSPSGFEVRDHDGLTDPDAVIRPAEPEDVPGVLRLWAIARSEHAATPDRQPDVERLVHELPGSLLVAERDGELVGALIAAWDGWRGNMYRLSVHPIHRRQRIGLALVRAGETRLRERGARRVTALVAHDDRVAAALWDAAGYPRDSVIGRRVRNL